VRRDKERKKMVRLAKDEEVVKWWLAKELVRMGEIATNGKENPRGYILLGHTTFTLQIDSALILVGNKLGQARLMLVAARRTSVPSCWPRKELQRYG
jgi:hypothetical protein